MKGNNELERVDIRLHDLEVEDSGCEISAYVETWFDVDKKFHVDTASSDGTWMNMYAFFNPYEDTLKILCMVERDDGSEEFYYEPTKNEAELIKDMIAQKLQIENDQSAREFCEQYANENLEAMKQ